MRRALLCVALLVWPVGAFAQQDQTLADIRQELTVLYVEIQRLNRELSTTGGASVAVTGNTVLERLSSIEAEVQRLTAQTEQLEFRVARIVEDGTNRIGDLEFRLVELEGGDIGALGETTTLGGEDTGGTAIAAAPATPAPSTPTVSPPTSTLPETELAVGEQDDFERAQLALAEGRYQEAAEQFEAFTVNYPGGPLAAGAQLGRGEALDALGDTREAARAFLAAFSAAPTGPVAAQSLYRLGRSLGDLGQTSEACVTLSEVAIRFPTDPAVAQADEARRTLACP